MSSIALPYGYRWQIRNDTGEAIDASNITLYGRLWAHDTAGAPDPDTSQSSWSGDNTTLADGSYDQLGSNVSNATDLFEGGDFLLEADLSGETAPDGTISLWLQLTTAASPGAGDFPDDGTGELCAVLSWSGTAAVRRKQFQL